MSDNVFNIPETLISTGLKYSQKAQDVLSLHSSLDAFSQTLHDSLPNEHARYAIDNFWVNWSAAMLNMASECEAIGNLLVKAAITFLKTDVAISKAFHGDKAEQDKINAEIDQANNQLDKFKQQYTQETQTDDSVKQRTDEEQKDLTLHNGQNMEDILSWKDYQQMKDVTFRVDKDGNITEEWSEPHNNFWDLGAGVGQGVGPATVSTKKVDRVYFNGHWVQSGSDEAKAIHNGTDGGTTSKDPNSISDGSGNTVVL
jgi:hypothetical protein